MKALIECANEVECVGRTSWRGILADKKGLVLEVASEEPFALFLIDDGSLIPSGKRCDGLLVAESGQHGLTCLLELKGAIDPEDADRPFAQILGALEYFAPGGAGAGESHHADWRAGKNLPTAPRGRRVHPLALGRT